MSNPKAICCQYKKTGGWYVGETFGYAMLRRLHSFSISPKKKFHYNSFCTQITGRCDQTFIFWVSVSVKVSVKVEYQYLGKVYRFYYIRHSKIIGIDIRSLVLHNLIALWNLAQ